MTTTFSSKTLTMLYHAGWFPERNVDITPYVHALEHGGYTAFPVVQAFLHRFGGLILKHETVFRGQILTSTTYIDPIDATSGFNPERTLWYAEQLGTPLCTVGWISNGHAALLMSQVGKMYRSYHNLVFWGDTGEEAIERLCNEGDGVVLLDE